MASEQVLDVAVRRHVLTSERPFQVVLDGIYTGISQPDLGALFAKLAASTSYEEFTGLQNATVPWPRCAREPVAAPKAGPAAASFQNEAHD